MIVRAYKSTQSNLSEAHYQKIFIPLDGSQRAECLLPLATSLAEFHEATLILAHAIRKPELPRRAPLSPEERELAQQITEHNLNEASRYLEQLQSRFPVKMEGHIAVSEDVADELHELVSQENPDLVLINAHGYSSSVQHPYGSLALNFIAYGTTPLLIVQDVPDLYALFGTPAEMASREFPGH
jgi:nucleotide-binding universal stress UspA family protein